MSKKILFPALALALFAIVLTVWSLNHSPTSHSLSYGTLSSPSSSSSSQIPKAHKGQHAASNSSVRSSHTPLTPLAASSGARSVPPAPLSSTPSTSSISSSEPAQSTPYFATTQSTVSSVSGEAAVPPVLIGQGPVGGAAQPAYASGGGEAVWELPAGVKVPAAFMETGEDLSSQAAAANEQIAQDFEKEVENSSTASNDGSTEISDEAWQKALNKSDELYRALYGDAAYNMRGMAATADAKASTSENP